MTTIIGSVFAQSVTLKPASGVEKPSSVQNAATSFSLPQTDTANPNQRLVVDPQAGVITEFFSSRGDVQVQIPSSVVVAYLRAGLTEDGLTREQATKAEPSVSA